jgi:apolipoprotein D and lipocalin family protein
MSSMRRLMILAVALLLAGCSSSGSQLAAPQTVAQVDLQRYQGTWYELARLPMFFQRNCAQSEAQYRLQADATISVLNSCRTLEGELLEANGQAFAQQAGKTDKLWVRFDNWFSRLFPTITRGDYWVLYVDDDYQVALVGNPNRQFLWLLSRTPQVSAKTRAQLLDIAHQRGYDTDALIWRVADQSMPKP